MVAFLSLKYIHLLPQARGTGISAGICMELLLYYDSRWVICLISDLFLTLKDENIALSKHFLKFSTAVWGYIFRIPWRNLLRYLCMSNLRNSHCKCSLIEKYIHITTTPKDKIDIIIIGSKLCNCGAFSRLSLGQEKISKTMPYPIAAVFLKNGRHVWGTCSLTHAFLFKDYLYY